MRLLRAISTVGAVRGLLRPVLAALALLAGTAIAQTPLVIAHASWSSSRASAHVVAELLRRELQVPVELRQLPIEEAWEAVATGEADVLLSAWLPDTHAPYLERYGAEMVDLGPSLEGTRTGLAVPDVGASRQTGPGGARGATAADVTRIADLAGHAERYGGVIVGIDEGAGVMRQTREALRAYGLTGWSLLATGSEAAMLERLSAAVRRGQPIVVTAWVPLWANARWNLRFLEDPRGVFGRQGAIHTMVRDGLGDERPEVTAVLDAFSWTPTDMERVMIWMEERSAFPGDVARRWLNANDATVRDWLGSP
ncbi:MAG: glycine/betaine ABC transporter substrate-binding protein [Deinococcus-Thermus bacterium]|nr:glycine/betaine ABC transporter substrate-binding protein [Deinococcota bacterium]